MISGFVILLTAYNRSASSFVISRITRLYPAFWFSVTLTAVVIVLYGESRFTVELNQYLFNLSMISGFFGVEHIDKVYWSLLVELKFYFLVFLLIILNQIHFMKYYLGFWLLFTYVDYFTPLPGVFGFFIFPEWSFYFIAGVTFFLIRVEGLSIFKILLVLLSYVIALLKGFEYLERISTLYDEEYSELVLSIIISVFYIFFFLIAVGKTKFFNRKSFIFWGALTYPLYLLHQNIGYIFFHSFTQADNKYIILLVLILLMLTASYLVNNYIERIYGKKLKLYLDRLSESFKGKMGAYW